jgi:hypothetical protein
VAVNTLTLERHLERYNPNNDFDIVSAQDAALLETVIVLMNEVADMRRMLVALNIAPRPSQLATPEEVQP